LIHFYKRPKKAQNMRFSVKIRGFLLTLTLTLLGGAEAKNIIEGSYNLDGSTNFQNYLKELGVGWLLRNLAGLADPTVTLSRDCGEEVSVQDTSCTWKMYTSTVFKSHTVSFQLGEQVNDYTMDGRQVKSVYTLEGDDSLVEIQRGDGPETRIVREFDSEEMTVNLQVNNVKATSVFHRL